ncbi:MAG: hypothetical protein AAFZ92_09850 [Pseudomonadota bacterium]
MSKAVSSSEPSESDGDFIDITDDDAVNDDGLDPSPLSADSSQFTDSRRRLEARIAERQLQKDIQEFNFDF